MSSSVKHVHNTRPQSFINAGLHLGSLIGNIVSAIVKLPTAPIQSIYAKVLKSRFGYYMPNSSPSKFHQGYVHYCKVKHKSLSGVGKNLKNAFIDLIGIVSNLAFAVFGAPKSGRMPKILEKIKERKSLGFVEQIILKLHLPVEGLKTKMQQDFHLITPRKSDSKLIQLFSQSVA